MNYNSYLFVSPLSPATNFFTTTLTLFKTIFTWVVQTIYIQILTQKLEHRNHPNIIVAVVVVVLLL